jgi:carboxypeptidase Taq
MLLAALAPAVPSSYDALLVRVQRMDALKQTLYQLEWDQHTYMPPGGVEARSQEVSVLSALRHELLTAPETGRLLAEAEKSETDEARRAVLREVRWEHDRAARVPTSLVEAHAKEASVAFPAWVEAKKRSDFATFRPHLERLVELRREYAAAVDPGAPAYAVLFNDYEPTIPLADARRILSALREGLRPLVARAPRRDAPTTFHGTWPADKQLELCKRIVAMLGYDFHHGRLDVSPHPFTSGNQYDSRITTRFDEANPTSGLLAAIHEAGHALYQLGLPKEHFGDPLGDARDLVVHESQSRLWENHVGRSLPFWEQALPVFHEVFGAAMPRASAEACWRAVNHVQPSLIRVYADELTYHMHIALRFEIEEALVSGKLAVREVPATWNDLMQKYLGIAPPDDARGCLQDMHWSGGTFGYFPTYSLGSILSAQLYATFQKTAAAAPTDHAALRAWLVEHVHKHGKRYPTMELVRRATGAPLGPEAFLAYANDKYGRLWAGG